MNDDPLVSRRREVFSPYIGSRFGLEIGPSYLPLYRKAEGFNIKILDHCTASELKEKYFSHEHIAKHQLELIEEVDYILEQDGKFPKEIHGSEFEFIVANHVIEHSPDLIQFFLNLDSISSSHCTLLLAVPDKNLMFDYYRPLSTLGDVFLAHLDQFTYDHKVRLDSLYFGSTKSGIIAWDKSTASEPRLPTPMSSEFEIIKEMQDQSIVGLSQNGYIDRHRWVFSPAVFEDVVSKLFLSGLINWRIITVEEGLGCEFLVVLEKGLQSGNVESLPNPETRSIALAEYAPTKFVTTPSVTLDQMFNPLTDSEVQFVKNLNSLINSAQQKVFFRKIVKVFKMLLR